jgi:hypothetical protein
MSDDQQPHPKLAQVRALLAQAEDPAATPAEAERFSAKAFELMAKYGIERAMLADAEPELDRPGDRVIHVEGAYTVDRIALLRAITRPLNLQSIRLRDRQGRITSRIHVFGYEADLDRAEMLFTSLLLQAFNGMKHGRPAYGESPVAYRKTWLMGFSQAVEARLEAAEARARNDAPTSPSGRSAELVLADRASVVLARFQGAYPKIKKGGTRTIWGSGFNAGQAAGNRADLGATRVRGSARRAVAR